LPKLNISFEYHRFFGISNVCIRWRSPDFKTSRKLKETAKIAQINARPYQKQEQDVYSISELTILGTSTYYDF
jgi:hypothetical protein